VTNLATAKESTPANATSTATSSKKRKAAAAAVPSAQGALATSSTPPPAAARKPVIASAATSVIPARESNVMTFSKHRSCLNKKGELIADDGTKLNVNGK
jgi:hypothetical protein